jgi:hypothetical protein|tara:strand:- start:11188 stop:12510 length:1323 start_codon:yes stop_codon:yes gene_type:complete
MRNFYFFTFLTMMLGSSEVMAQGPWTFTNDNEIWASTGTTANIAAGAAYSILTINGAGNPQIVTTEANVNADLIDHVSITIQNNSDNLRMRFIFKDATGANRYVDTDITANDSEFKTYTINPGKISSWIGTINSITIQFKADSDNNVAVDTPANANFYIDDITMLTPSYSGILQNSSFEDVPGDLANWSPNGNATQLASTPMAITTTESSDGNQSAEFTINSVLTGNPPQLWNKYLWSMDPNPVNNSSELTVTWDMKATSVTGDPKVSPRWRMNISSGAVTNTDGTTPTQRATYGVWKSATTEWTTVTNTKELSTPTTYDDEFYDNIELGFTLKNGAVGTKVYIDNIVTTISGTTLGYEDVSGINPSAIKAFPNPVSSFLNIETSDEIVGMRVINMLGQIVIIQKGSSKRLTTSSLNTGLYILKVTHKNGNESSIQIVKK